MLQKGMGPAKQLRGFLLLIFLFFPLLLHADGKVFTQAVAVSAKTPDQRALLYYSNGVERLVIETSFVGEGTNFAWVVPLPSVPKIEAVGENFFPSLSSAYQPKIIYKPSLWSLGFLAFGAMLSISIYSFRRGGSSGLGIWIGLMFLVASIFAIGMPSLAKARGGFSEVPAGTVSILDQQKVGAFETVTLIGTDGGDLLQWLNQNGFHTPSNTLPVLSRYAADKWVFVATRLERDHAGAARSQPHPLSFTFESKTPVYPLRLTGIDNGDCSFELFVFGPGRATAKHFEVEYCGEPSGEPSVDDEEGLLRRDLRFFAPPRPGEFRIMNPEVRAFALPAPVTTKLIGTLSPEQMAEDAKIEWQSYAQVFPTLYSRTAASRLALNWFVGIFVIGGLCVQIVGPYIRKRTSVKAIGAVLIAGIVCAGAVYASLDVTDVRILRGGHYSSMNRWALLDGMLAMYSADRNETTPLTFEEIVANAPKYIKWGSLENPLTGEPLRHEASPGNIILRQGTNGTDVLWYDINANPHLVATFK